MSISAMNGTHHVNPWLVIVNPNAGSRKGQKDWLIIKGLLDAAGLNTEVRFTEGKGDATRLALAGIRSGHRRIITVGGDGTLNEVVNGVMENSECNPVEISLGLIPVGTGNDWGKMFGIPAEYATAVNIIKENRTLMHDVGILKYTAGVEQKTRFFINTAGFGFESVVVHRTNYQKDRGRGGKLVYLCSLLTSLFSYRNTPAWISIDNQEIHANIFSVNIGNGRFCGGGMRQTPEALPDDGYLDVTIIKGMGKFEIIRNLDILYNGKILQHPKITGYRCKNLEINSDSSIYAEADGESLGHVPASVGIIPSALCVIYGEKLNP